MSHSASLGNLVGWLLLLLASVNAAAAAEPVVLLDLPGSGTDPEKIDYAALPRLKGTHCVISPAGPAPENGQQQKADYSSLKFQLHNYLVHHAGRFWCIWSEGPPVEDEPTQEVRYATSQDGLTWSASRSVTGRPEDPYAFIARGLWVRDGQLLALAAHFKGKGAFGVNKELELRAYAWDEASGQWQFKQKLYDNAINNFPPQQLSSGDWIVTRRDARFNVFMLIGGREALDRWESFPVIGLLEVPGFRPDEPILWILPDKTLVALFRDNGGSRRLFQSLSADEGRTWSRPAPTNFPNAPSKLFSIETSQGYRVLVSNANPQAGRHEMYVSVSRDGRRFVRMALLDIPSPPVVESAAPAATKFRAGIATLQYPHALEQDGQLWIAFSRNKKQIELFRVPLSDVDALLRE